MNNSRFTASIPKGYVAKGKTNETKKIGPLHVHPYYHPPTHYTKEIIRLILIAEEGKNG
jgi:hypothetical protein